MTICSIGNEPYISVVLYNAQARLSCLPKTHRIKNMAVNLCMFLFLEKSRSSKIKNKANIHLFYPVPCCTPSDTKTSYFSPPSVPLKPQSSLATPCKQMFLCSQLYLGYLLHIIQSQKKKVETWYETQHEAKAFSSYRLVLKTQWQCLICVRAGIIENWKNINF